MKCPDFREHYDDEQLFKYEQLTIIYIPLHANDDFGKPSA